MEHRQAPTSPTQVIAQRVRQLRDRRGWTADQLAEAMASVGVPWTRIVVTKLETGRRPSVSVEEWLALAYVLGVAPVHLLVPLHDGYFKVVPTDQPHEELGHDRATAPTRDVRDWIAGKRPLESAFTDQRVYYSEVPEDEFRARFGHGSGIVPGGVQAS